MVGGEVTVLRAKDALQLEGIARGKRHDGLQPKCGPLGDSLRTPPVAMTKLAPMSVSVGAPVLSLAIS